MPRPRTIFKWSILIVVLALVTWVASEIHWAYTAKPGSAIDFSAKMEELVDRFQSPDVTADNRWPDFVSVVDMVKSTQSELVAVLGGEDAKPQDWPETWTWPVDSNSLRDEDAPAQVREPTLAMLKDLESKGIFEKLDALTAARRFVRPIPKVRLIDVLLPELGASRELARINTGRMYLAHRAADGPGLVRAVGHNLTIARILAHQSTLIDRLVAVAILKMTLQELRQELLESPFDAATMRSLLVALDGLELPSIELPLEGERIFCLDTIQWTHTDDGMGSGRLLPVAAARLAASTGLNAVGASQHSLTNLTGMFAPSKAETVAAANDFYDTMVAYAKLDRTARSGAKSPDAIAESLPKRQVILRLMLPALGKAVSTDDQLKVEVGGTRLMLAIELVKVERGKYPETLAELAPSILATLPKDPFSPTGLVYWQVREGADPLNRPYLLYSIGADGKDNDGTRHPTTHGHALAGTREGNGFDYVLNEPRETK